MTQLLINVAGHSDSDDVNERVRLTDELREELLELDVDDVRRPQADAVAGTKGSALEWAQLVVSVAGALPPLMIVVQSWLRRNPGSTVSVSIDGDKLTLSDASLAERREMVDAWLGRHAA